jgi:hypothetical protein
MCEVLVHVLGHEAPQMMRQLLDIATKYAMGEEAV